MKSTRVSPILFLGFAVIFLLSVAVQPVMAADAQKTHPDTDTITGIPASQDITPLWSSIGGTFSSAPAILMVLPISVASDIYLCT